MLIPEFWVGVMATLFLETITVIIAAAVSYNKNKR